jgi:hypothetical protein
MNSIIFPPIPLDTAKAARSVFGSSHFYLVIGDQVDDLFSGLGLQNSSGPSERHINKLATLYLITIFQHMESLPDQVVMDALRQRLDWKYALHLPMNNALVESYPLCEIRTMLSLDPTIKQTAQMLLERLANLPHASMCTWVLQDVDLVITHVCRISRLTKIWEAMNQALEALATRQPEWLLNHSLPYWYERYGYSPRSLSLRVEWQEQEDFIQAIGSDGFYLLESITRSEANDLDNLPEIFVLRKVWIEQFERVEGKATLRKEACAGCSLRL